MLCSTLPSQQKLRNVNTPDRNAIAVYVEALSPLLNETQFNEVCLLNKFAAADDPTYDAAQLVITKASRKAERKKRRI